MNGRQVVIRMPAELVEALERDAAENERTLAASVRYLVRRGLESNYTPGIRGDASGTMVVQVPKECAATETPPTPASDRLGGMDGR